MFFIGIISKIFFIDEPDKSYTSRWMKKKLSDHFKDEIVITNIKGKSNVITFLPKVAKILDRSRENIQADPEKEKQQIIETAASIIQDEIKQIDADFSYPSLEDFSTLSKVLCRTNK